MGEDRPPLGVAGCVQRSLGQREVLRAVVVHDQQPVAGRLHVVLDALPARCHDPRLALRVVGAEHPVLRGELAPRRDQHPALVTAAVDTEPEPLVGLGEHGDVLGRVGAQPVPQHQVRAPRLVGSGIEQVAVLGPGHPVRRVLDPVRQQLTGRQVLDQQREALGAAEVDRVRQQSAVDRDAERTEGEELLACGFDVAVQQHLLAADRVGDVRGSALVRGRRPAVDRVLRALDGAGVVPERRTVAVGGVARHGEVGLQRPGLDLGEDRVAQRREVRGPGLGVGVLGLEIGDHLRVVLRPQPFVGIGEPVAVVDPVRRPAVSDRRHRPARIGGMHDREA